MIYPKDFEQKIGYGALKTRLLRLCRSEMGKSWVETDGFSSNFDEVRRRLQSTSEMKGLIERGIDLPLDGMYDVAPYLVEIRSEGSFMSADRLYQLCMLLRELAAIRSFFSTDGEKESATPVLAEMFDDTAVFPEIIREIEKVVNKFGEVKDDASPALYELRREIQRVQASMSSVMRRVIERAASHGTIEKDTAPSVRDGRLVIPVNSSRKREISGIVHDASATGKTVYIEPTEVVQTANRLRELQMEEQREIVIILTQVANLLRPEIDAILESMKTVGHFDFIHAKAQLAIVVGGEMPKLERNQELDWFHAVHPILKLTLEEQGREVVPLDLNLNKEQRILVISGPNAGGKSVALKTVGIVQYMLQCGLLPTLYSNSHVSVFRNIFVDIGDEQSIENDLSTYSSHLRNMKHFLRFSNERTLFLADEMGSGTEPQIGGALAQAILHSLNKKKCFGIVTTHYQNLKTFADHEEGLINGAMLYDRQHLQPLFQLAVGSPGSSFALEIARKTGLDSDVIEEAKNIVGSDYVNIDKYMLDIARDRRYWANKRASIKEKERKIEDALEKYETKADDLRARRSEILRDARREAKEIMSGANARLENAIHEIKKAQAERERTKEIRAELEKYKQNLNKDDIETLPAILKPVGRDIKLRNRDGQERSKKCSEGAKRGQRQLLVGDYVRMSDGGVSGRILSISGNKAEVAFGGLRTIVALDKLKSASKPKESAKDTVFTISQSSSDDSRRRQLNFKQEIDVRGMRADEALQAVTYFLDDAIQFNAGRVRILHGTGHGILRTLIRQQLLANPAVVSAVDEDVRFGGAGITVVTLE